MPRNRHLAWECTVHDVSGKSPVSILIRQAFMPPASIRLYIAYGRSAGAGVKGRNMRSCVNGDDDYVSGYKVWVSK